MQFFTVKDMNTEIIKTNKYWKEGHNPLVSIITSNYNRREVLLRCMRSVEAQTFRDIEYIVVDNGSSVSFDDIMEQFMEEATIPVMFIKRTSGLGPHTGRNSAIREARGEYLSMIDSDDEYLPQAMEVLVNAWKQIPQEQRDEYREVVALCQDEHGHQIGAKFPAYMNQLPRKETRRLCLKPEYQCEHANMSRTSLLKENPFQEPEGINYVSELAVWYKLDKKYKSFYLDDVIKKYYTGSGDSISNQDIKKVTIQGCCNIMWDNLYLLNNWGDYELPFTNRLKRVLYYSEMKYVLKKKGMYPKYKWMKTKLKGLVNYFLSIVLYVPSLYKAKELLKEI